MMPGLIGNKAGRAECFLTLSKSQPYINSPSPVPEKTLVSPFIHEKRNGEGLNIV